MVVILNGSLSVAEGTFLFDYLIFGFLDGSMISSHHDTNSTNFHQLRAGPWAESKGNSDSMVYR